MKPREQRAVLLLLILMAALCAGNALIKNTRKPVPLSKETARQYNQLLSQGR